MHNSFGSNFIPLLLEIYIYCSRLTVFLVFLLVIVTKPKIFQVKNYLFAMKKKIPVLLSLA